MHPHGAAERFFKKNGGCFFFVAKTSVGVLNMYIEDLFGEETKIVRRRNKVFCGFFRWT